MAVTREDVGALLRGAFNTPEELYQDSVRLHKLWYWIGMAILLVLITIEVMMSYAELPIFIAIINAALIPILGFYVSCPAAFLSMFGVGAGWKLTSYNWSWHNLFEEGTTAIPDIQVSDIVKQGWQTYISTLKLPAHFLIIAISTGTILAMVHVEHPTQALLFFPALATIGVWAFAHGGSRKWYRKITIAVLVIGSIMSLYSMLGGHEKMEKMWGNFFYSKTLEIEVSSLQPQKLCGVQPGHRKFAIPHESYVILNGDNYEITSFVRVNGTLPNQVFSVGDDGCVDISFSFPSSTLEKTVTPQVIQIAFR